ncbi:sulfotransferase family protein [Mangrovimonas sp. CR14]|uniref:sulfotransferase family 2 domain-containing protein n=1 Tax=Mangrovimonas sp. CR14 TaxID=2706120 RepID=UPI0014249261|nr:sulfotransferase family 2 domain-containing protein [Mangrovimonas sp. CR14]NIK92518.1 sulfotransferase family protein [Mangrovimonas sp. CR14]
MISHKHKCIFIHIPKTAGTSINEFFFPEVEFGISPPNYDILFGWCPVRKIHMQHATARQMLETELITEEQWNTYYKFTFVRNPWDRAYSDFMWIQNFSGVRGDFSSYIKKTNKFGKILTNNEGPHFLGDHLLQQTDFFDFKGVYKPDFIGRFENFDADIHFIINKLDIKEEFNLHKNKTLRYSHYSNFYTRSKKKLVNEYFQKDISLLGYKFENKRVGFKNNIKRFI